MKTLSKKTKIVVIGAGSASFGLVNLGAIIRHPALKGIHLALVDINEKGLNSITALAQRMNKEWHSEMTISSTTDRKLALQGADFVILSVAIDREDCWKSDVDIALKYGIRHYGENGGPGALMHTARNVALIMPILKDIESICPQAYVMNFTNPVPRVCIAAARYTKVKMVGICHAIDFAYLMFAKFFEKDFNFEVPEGYRFTWEGDWDAYGHMAHQAQEKVEILAAGVNHFTFILSIKDKTTGEDYLPEFKQRFLKNHLEFEPYTRDIIECFDVVPVSGDAHMLEYLPFTHNVSKKSWEHYDIQMYPLGKAQDDRYAMWDEIELLAKGEGTIDHLLHTHTERAEQIIVAMMNGETLYDQAVNIPNLGYITNLPQGAIVEVPAWINQEGIQGKVIGDLPDAAAVWVSREIQQAEMAVKAAVTGDKKLMLQALLICPMVDDISMAKAMLNEYLEANRKYLPAFNEKGE